MGATSVSGKSGRCSMTHGRPGVNARAPVLGQLGLPAGRLATKVRRKPQERKSQRAANVGVRNTTKGVPYRADVGRSRGKWSPAGSGYFLPEGLPTPWLVSDVPQQTGVLFISTQQVQPAFICVFRHSQ